MYEFTAIKIQFFLGDNISITENGLIFFRKVTCLLLESYIHKQIVGKAKLDSNKGAMW